MNTTFTLANEPQVMVSLWFDGAIYTDFTQVGTTVTLTDAPTTEIFVDYLTGLPYVVAGPSGNSFSEIIAETYRVLAQRTTSTTYPLDTVKGKINSTIRRVLSGEYTDITNPQRVYQAGDLRFLRQKHPLTRTQEKSVTTAASAGDTVIEFDTTGFPDTGHLIVNGNVVYYGAKTSTSVTGVDNLVVDIDEGDKIRQVYQIPEQADKSFRLFFYDKQSYRETEIEYEDFKFQKTKVVYWTVIGDETTDMQFVDIRGEPRFYNNSTLYWLYYYVKANELSADDDITAIPDQWGVDMIAPIVAGELLWNTEKADRGQLNLADAYAKLNDFYSHYTKQIKEFRPKVRVKPYFNNS